MKKFSDFTPEQIQEARKRVAGDWREMVNKIRSKDNYASHVTEQEKDDCQKKGLDFAAEIESGLHDSNFTVAQRLYFVLTGESVPLLAKTESKITGAIATYKPQESHGFKLKEFTNTPKTLE